MSAPSEAERLWMAAHDTVHEALTDASSGCPHRDGKCYGDECCVEHDGHDAIDAAVRAAFEEGVRYSAAFAAVRPTWLPAGAKEDK